MSILLIILMFLFPASAQEVPAVTAVGPYKVAPAPSRIEVPAVTAETCHATPEEALREMRDLMLELQKLGQNPQPGDLTVMLDEAFDRKCGRELMEAGKVAMIGSLARLEGTSAPERIAPEDEPTVDQKTTPPSEMMPAEDEPVPNRVELADEPTVAPIPRRMPTIPVWTPTQPPPPERIVAPEG